MKLFGNRRSGGRAASRKDAAQARRTHDAAQPAAPRKSGRNGAAPSEKAAKPESRFGLVRKWNGLPGWARGVILLVAALLLLVGVIAFVWKMVVRPPDIKQSKPAATTEGDDESETFRLPTNVTIIKDIDPETGEEIDVEVEVPASHKSDYYNILIAGTDKDGGRTDTIMIARLDVKEHTVALLSVPRDTLIDARYSVPKINSAYGAGGQGAKGMETLRTQLARLLGFEVDGYVLVDFDAFSEIIELVGDEENGVKGIWFDVPQRMYYTDPTQNLYIDLYPGYQHLNANQCEQLVRYRYGYANADIGRISVQQDFVRALANQCLKIGNITKIQGLAEIFIDYVTTDLTVGNMVYFGQELLKCNFDDMPTFTLEGEAVGINGGSYYRIYTNKMLKLVNEYFNPYDTEITTANIAVASYSSSSSSSGSHSSTGSSSSGSSSSGSTTTEPSDPATTDPGETDTTEPDPGTTDPGTTEPGTTDPGGATQPDSGTTEPGTTDPGTTDPGTTEPDPGTTTPDPGTGGQTEPLPDDLEGWGA